jgi:hypothetical protein
MLCKQVKEKILNILQKEAYPLLDRSGSILYSSPNTVREGDYFVFGLNPGGNPSEGETIKDDLERIYQNCLKNPYWNAYFDEDWDGSGKGNHKLQRNLRYFAELFWGNEEFLRRVCASNLSFIRAESEDKVEDEDLKISWSVNKWLLQQVKPKIIMVFSKKGFDFLKKKFPNTVFQKSIRAYWGNWKIELIKVPVNEITNKETFILRVPHLSRYTFKGREHVVEEIKQYL